MLAETVAQTDASDFKIQIDLFEQRRTSSGDTVASCDFIVVDVFVTVTSLWRTGSVFTPWAHISGRIAVGLLRTLMRPIVTDRAAWSVCRSVGLSHL